MMAKSDGSDRVEIQMSDSEYLTQLAIELDDAERLGAEEDDPEGVRWIQISDTLAKMIAQKLRHISSRVDN